MYVSVQTCVYCSIIQTKSSQPSQEKRASDDGYAATQMGNAYWAVFYSKSAISQWYRINIFGKITQMGNILLLDELSNGIKSPVGRFIRWLSKARPRHALTPDPPIFLLNGVARYLLR